MFSKQLLRHSRRIISVNPISPHIQSSSFSHLSPARPFLLSSTIPSRTVRRWQSSEAETQKVREDAVSESSGSTSSEQTAPADPTKQELEKSKREVIDLKDKYLRSVADYRNLQDRTKRDMDSARQFAIQRFASDILDSIDNLDRALTSVPQSSLQSTSDTTASTTSNTSSSDPNAAASSESVSSPSSSSSSASKDLQNLYNGLKMSDEVMMNTLKKHGIERFDPLEGGGRKFNPNTDEATFYTKVEGKQDGDVFYTQSKGYILNGRVIRAAKVGVVKNS